MVGPTVTATTSLPEAEEYIAVDPNNSSKLVAAISDFSFRSGSNTTKYAVSTNGGASWLDSFVPFPTTSDGLSWQYNSDPVVAIDKLGHVYLADLYFNSSTGNNANGLYVGVGTVAAESITAATTYPVAVNPDPATNNFEDKEWIAVDNSSSSFSGRVYVSWTRFVGSTDYILLSYSTNYGQTWSTAPLQISLTTQNGAVQGSQVAVGPDGSVYVVYEVSYVGGKRQQFIAKSTDGGVSFSTPVAATPRFNELSFNSSFRKNSFASLAVAPAGPNSGIVYIVYSDQPSSGAGAQVEFVRSTAAGATTFTSPVVINDVSAGQQFMPAVTVDASGIVHASWFDTRNNSKNTTYYDIYATYTANNGTSFAPNARVTSASIYCDKTSFIGDYAGIAAAGGVAHPVWTSGGFNGGRLQTAVLTLP